MVMRVNQVGKGLERSLAPREGNNCLLEEGDRIEKGLGTWLQYTGAYCLPERHISEIWEVHRAETGRRNQSTFQRHMAAGVTGQVCGPRPHVAAKALWEESPPAPAHLPTCSCSTFAGH